MSKEEFLSGKPFTALNTEGSYVFIPIPGKKNRIGYIKDAKQKESGDVYCVVIDAIDWENSVYCTRFMLGSQVMFNVHLENLRAVQEKPKKDKEVSHE